MHVPVDLSELSDLEISLCRFRMSLTSFRSVPAFVNTSSLVVKNVQEMRSMRLVVREPGPLA